MRYLTVIYDSDCGLCARMIRWLMGQPKWIPLRVLPLSQAGKMYPELAKNALREELTVVNDEGGVYVGDHAWLICLHALRRYRRQAQRLSRPGLRPFARQAFKIVSANRYRVSRWLEDQWLEDAWRKHPGGAPMKTERSQIQGPHCHGTNT
jgi:predicted DCC family thiol-disulfide oxidoreductase YuxK